MEGEKLVSVIIPVFNVRRYICEALDSVIKQSYEHLEIIIIDDGSDDGTEEICEKFAIMDGRIRLIHQENRGLSAARNVGLGLMTGELVAFLDADDAYSVNYISSMIHAMNCSESDMIVCKFCECYTANRMERSSKNTKPAIQPGIYHRKEALKALANGLINQNVWNKLYKRDLWNDVRFPDGHVYEDVDTTFRIINECNSIFVLDQMMYMRRIRSDSITSTYSLNNTMDWIRACVHFESFIENNIPGVFSNAHLMKVRQAKLKQLISIYIHGINCKEEKWLKELRKQITEGCDEELLFISKISTKIQYYLIRYCPCLLRIAYPIYHRIRVFQRKVVGTFRM